MCAAHDACLGCPLHGTRFARGRIEPHAQNGGSERHPPQNGRMDEVGVGAGLHEPDAPGAIQILREVGFTATQTFGFCVAGMRASGVGSFLAPTHMTALCAENFFFIYS